MNLWRRADTSTADWLRGGGSVCCILRPDRIGVSEVVVMEIDWRLRGSIYRVWRICARFCAALWRGHAERRSCALACCHRRLPIPVDYLSFLRVPLLLIIPLPPLIPPLLSSAWVSKSLSPSTSATPVAPPQSFQTTRPPACLPHPLRPAVPVLQTHFRRRRVHRYHAYVWSRVFRSLLARYLELCSWGIVRNMSVRLALTEQRYSAPWLPSNAPSPSPPPA